MPLIPRKIHYEIHSNPPQEGRPLGFHIRVTDSEVVSTEDIIENYTRAQGIGNAHAVLLCLVNAITEELRKGNSVHIDGLGTFSPNITASVTPQKHKTRGYIFNVEDAKIKNVSFKSAEALLGNLRKDVSFVEMPSRTRYMPTNEEVYEYLDDFFTRKDVPLTRHDLLNRFPITPYNAGKLLERLVCEGRLRRIGRKGSTSYLPPHEDNNNICYN